MNLTINPLTLILLLILPVIFVASCTYDNEEELFGENDCGSIENVSYVEHVQNVLSSNCYVCHATSVSTGGVDLENFESLKAIAFSGRLIGSIAHEAGYPTMPPSGQLDACTIEKIRVWIQEGALDN